MCLVPGQGWGCPGHLSWAGGGLVRTEAERGHLDHLGPHHTTGAVLKATS